MEITVLYYSACVDDEGFEKRIRDNILSKKGSLPIISVTQKPVDFGTNVCVGTMPVSYESEFEQIRRGLVEVKTSHVLVTESDTLYPEDYFTPNVSGEAPCYRYGNVYVHYVENYSNNFLFKKYSHCAQLVNRNAWLENLSVNKHYQFPQNYCGHWNGSPVVTFKTRSNVSKKTQVLKRPPVTSLPYWGDVENLRKEFI